MSVVHPICCGIDVYEGNDCYSRYKSEEKRSGRKDYLGVSNAYERYRSKYADALKCVYEKVFSRR